MEYSPYTSVWGSVTNVTIAPDAPDRRGQVLVTIAEQVLCFRGTTDNELETLGLLRLSKRRSRRRARVFLIVMEKLATRTHHILAGWKNPPDLLVRELQPVILADDTGGLIPAIIKTSLAHSRRPSWKDFDFEG